MSLKRGGLELRKIKTMWELTRKKGMEEKKKELLLVNNMFEVLSDFFVSIIFRPGLLLGLHVLSL